jgi:hypothetical protein
VSRWIERIGLDWIAELRPVTCLAIALHDFDETVPDAVGRLGAIVRVIQEVVHSHDGSVDSVVVDDKGASVLAFFGTPPDAHSDDPVRSIQTATEIASELEKAGVQVTVGIATGRVFCGIVGNDARRSFLIVGNTIILAFRMAWRIEGGILVDEPTAQATQGRFSFGDEVLRLSLKGKAEPALCRIVPHRLEAQNPALATAGRGPEMAMLRRLWADVAEGSGTASVIVEGEAGLGKTALAWALRREVEASGGRFMFCTTSAIDRDTPYSALRRPLAELLGIAPGLPLADRAAMIAARVPEELLQMAPLLDAVLPTGLEETAQSAELSGQARVQAAEDLLVSLLPRLIGEGPICLCVEDAHFLDPATRSLLERLERQAKHLLIVALSQPVEGFERLAAWAEAGAHLVRLQHLNRAGVEELVCMRLGVAQVAPAVIDRLLTTTDGHPFHCVELLSNLIATGQVVVEDSMAVLAGGEAPQATSFPETLHGMVLQRLDRPEPEEQLSLRVASVAGQTFPTRLVSDIHPLPELRDSVHRHFVVLARANLVEPMAVGDRPGYGFRHAILREVVYNQLPKQDRASLHHRTAQWIERNSGADRASRLIELAGHWQEAGETAAAIDCLLEESLRLFRQGFAVDSVRVGLRAIALAGVGVPTDPDAFMAETGAALTEIGQATQGRSPTDLLADMAMPPLEVQIKLRALLSTAPFAFQSNQFPIFAWASARSMQLVIEAGGGPPHALSMFSIVLGALTGDRGAAAAWSRAALDMDAATGGGALPAVGFIDTWFHGHWREPLSQSVARNIAAAERALADNEGQYASYNISGEIVMRAALGQSLATIIARAEAAQGYPLHRNARVHAVLEQQFAHALRGETEALTSLSGAGVEEARDIGWVLNSEFVNQIGYYLVTRLRLGVLAGEWGLALALADQLGPLMPAIGGQTAEIDAGFYTALARLGRHLEGQPDPDPAPLQSDLARLDLWAGIHPGNFGRKAAIARAIEGGLGGDRAVAARRLSEIAATGPADEGLGDRALALLFAHRLCPGDATREAAISACRAWGATALAARLEAELASA